MNEKLCSLIFFFIKKIPHINKTQLVKLLYLADYEFYKCNDREITGVTYSFWRFGPYSQEITDCISDMVASGFVGVKEKMSLIMRKYYLYDILEDYDYANKLSGEELDFAEIIMDKYKKLSLNEIKNVAYKTEPMMNAEKGEDLDFKFYKKELSRKLKRIAGKIKPLKDNNREDKIELITKAMIEEQFN